MCVSGSAFLISLAVADLLLLLLCVPLNTIEYFMTTWGGDATVCRLASYVEMLSLVASVLNLTAVSFERSVSSAAAGAAWDQFSRGQMAGYRLSHCVLHVARVRRWGVQSIHLTMSVAGS